MRRYVWLAFGFGLCLLLGAAAENRLQGDPVVIGSGNLDVGDADSDGAVRISDGSSNYVTLDVGGLTGDWTMTLPSNDGTANQVLKTDGAGQTSWTTPTSGSLWTQGAGFAYLTATNEDIVVGGNTAATGAMFMDESAGELFLGTASTLDGVVTCYAGEGGSFSLKTNSTVDREYIWPLAFPAATGYMATCSTTGSMSWTLPPWKVTANVIEPFTAGDDVELGSNESLTCDGGLYLVQGAAPTGKNGYTAPYAGTDGRIYALDGTNTITHDLSIAQKQTWQLCKALDLFGDISYTELVNNTFSYANGTANWAGSVAQTTSYDFTNHQVDDDYTSILWPVEYRVDRWITSANMAWFMSFDKVGKAATLVVRMKRGAYTSVNPIGSCYIGINTEGTDDEAKQSCSLTTSWAEYTLTADLSAMGDQLEWYIEFIPTTNTSCRESLFVIYIDEITLTQWAG